MAKQLQRSVQVEAVEESLPTVHTGWFGIRVGETWLEDEVGNLIAHQCMEVVQAQCDQLRNPVATVKEF